VPDHGVLEALAPFGARPAGSTEPPRSPAGSGNMNRVSRTLLRRAGVCPQLKGRLSAAHYRGGISILAALALLVVLPAAAWATTVDYSSDEGGSDTTLEVTGDRGESNEITVRGQGGRLRVKDERNDIRNVGQDERSDGCIRQSSREFACTTTGRGSLTIDGEDGDDVITADLSSIPTGDARRVFINPGSGRDRVGIVGDASSREVVVRLEDGSVDQLSCSNGRGVRIGSRDPEDRIDDDCRAGDGSGRENGGAGFPPPAPPAPEAARVAGIECGIFNQNFVRDNTVGKCVAAGAQGLLGPSVPGLTVCQQARFSGRQPRGFRRSDLGACELAVTRTRGRYYYAGGFPAPPADPVRLAGIECGIFNQNFVRDNTVGKCAATGAQGLLNPGVPALTVCQQARFSGRQPRGFARSDLEACELAVTRARGRYFFSFL